MLISLASFAGGVAIGVFIVYVGIILAFHTRF